MDAVVISILQVMLASWEILVASSPYMLLGFFLAGLLKAFLPDNLVARHLGGSSYSGLVKAAALGVPIPLCSCGVLPAAAGLRKQGAGKGPTTAFLISTPETGVDSVAVTWALLDPFMAFFRPLAAFVTALVTGGMVQRLDREEQGTGPAGPGLTQDQRSMSGAESQMVSDSAAVEPAETVSCAGASCTCTELRSSAPAGQRLRKGMAFAFGDLFRDIAVWFLLGVLIAGAIAVWITPEMISRWLGNPLLAMLAMLCISVPLYVCATASTPIAAALVLKGLNPGAALVFLLAGPATNAAALAVIVRILGRRATIIYLAGIMICSLAMGILVDWIYGRAGGLDIWMQGAAEEEGGLLGVISALGLLGLFAWRWVEGLLRGTVRRSCGPVRAGGKDLGASGAGSMTAPAHCPRPMPLEPPNG